MTEHSHLPADDFTWLEEIHGPEPLGWVRRQNARTEAKLVDDGFRDLEQDILAVLDSEDRIPSVTKRGNHYYNFWRDKQNPRGLWRRTSWESYQSDDPEWQVLLDVDALAAAEGTDWVFAGSLFLRPEDGVSYRRALLRLSPDGSDAATLREFDVEERAFVPGGFEIPVAKSRCSWRDEDTLLLGTDFGPGSMTASSYPRTSRILRRGRPLAEAEPYFEVPEEHMLGQAVHDPTPGYERDLAVDVIDFFNYRTYLRRDGEWLPIDVPTDVEVSLHRQWLTLRPQTDWQQPGETYPAGSLLVIGLEDFLAGSRGFTVLFRPEDSTSLQFWSWTRNYLLLNLLQDVSSRILVLDPAAGWAAEELDACPPLHAVEAYAVDEEDGDDYWLVATGFLTPSTLSRGTIGATAAEVKQSPSFFDAAAYNVEQHFAVSADGTKVPYFQVGPKDLEYDGGNPTLLAGYGGFEVSRTPAYSGVTGRAWLQQRDSAGRGGVYVLANIRGGGEYGPGWHRAALQANRHRAYEDFAAVAQDLARRGVASRERLGCSGGSNGGLLVGNMLASYPELFGAVSCGVPLLDMARYTQLSAGYSWIAEYGDPADPEQWEFIRTFSPYHLVEAGTDYPDALIWTATSDDRVGPVQARKMAARMQKLGVENVWFHEALEGGHAGASDNRQAARLQALSHTFLWRALTG
ncbi:glutamate--cysteine ligase [Arthrobacter crystallopoietes BAB-32]|uniref:Glutamate--cysteine ligase n=1 Tax=Arthrobacter crystallopoietes BAB-32 TaxID=1246476 RepID=N1UZX9_9MICC|nr:prolyl oligopeptidase family serine peptidase [Arthrobacter crystallopoietes]EMY33372.1 glutamate--cysteine ligase [Arthrobacter crystallopoietes BAB-32]